MSDPFKRLEESPDGLLEAPIAPSIQLEDSIEEEDAAIDMPPGVLGLGCCLSQHATKLELQRPPRAPS